MSSGFKDKEEGGGKEKYFLCLPEPAQDLVSGVYRAAHGLFW